MDILVTCLCVSQRVQPQRDQRRLAGTSSGIGPYTIQVEATPPGRPLAQTVTLSSPRSTSVTRLVSRVLQRLPGLSKRRLSYQVAEHLPEESSGMRSGCGKLAAERVPTHSLPGEKRLKINARRGALQVVPILEWTGHTHYASAFVVKKKHQPGGRRCTHSELMSAWLFSIHFD